jgi:hypothetical protein
MLTLAPQADLAVFYEADAARYRLNGASTFPDTVTQDVFVRFFAHCPSIGFRRDGEDIGGILFDGTQAHIAVLPQHHGHWGALLKPALDWLFSLQREILVEVERDNARCHRFMRHVGWQCVDEKPDALVYRLVPQQGTRRTAHPVARRRVLHEARASPDGPRGRPDQGLAQGLSRRAPAGPAHGASHGSVHGSMPGPGNGLAHALTHGPPDGSPDDLPLSRPVPVPSHARQAMPTGFN